MTGRMDYVVKPVASISPALCFLRKITPPSQWISTMLSAKEVVCSNHFTAKDSASSLLNLRAACNGRAGDREEAKAVERAHWIRCWESLDLMATHSEQTRLKRRRRRPTYFIILTYLNTYMLLILIISTLHFIINIVIPLILESTLKRPDAGGNASRPARSHKRLGDSNFGTSPKISHMRLCISTRMKVVLACSLEPR